MLQHFIHNQKKIFPIALQNETKMLFNANKVKSSTCNLCFSTAVEKTYCFRVACLLFRTNFGNRFQGNGKVFKIYSYLALLHLFSNPLVKVFNFRVCHFWSLKTKKSNLDWILKKDFGDNKLVHFHFAMVPVFTSKIKYGL